MTSTARTLFRALASALLVVGAVASAPAAVTGASGPYRVSLSTVPETIPVGKVRVSLNVEDTSGKPIEGAHVRVLVKMPAMNMGEKETTAAPAGEPGVYATEAVFMMEGPYDAAIAIEGPRGTATVKIALRTGQNTATDAGGPSPLLLGLLAGAVLLAVFTVYRMRKTGQHMNGRAILNQGTLGGLLLIVAMLAMVVYAINRWRRPGAMTPIEAQAMEMNTPAPPGVAPVTLARVSRGAVENTVRCTGQALAFTEQDVAARAAGYLTWMPLYVGDRVKAGQVVARLDTSQIDPQITERGAALAMAQQAVTVAQAEYRQALAEARQAEGEAGMRHGLLAEARANVSAAREDRVGAESAVTVATSKVAAAQAQVDAAKADQKLAQQELARDKKLLAAGAASREEFERAQAQAAGAEAKAREAQASLTQANAEARSAQSALRKAYAVISAASNRVMAVQPELASHTAHAAAAKHAADAARARVAQAAQAVQQARGSLAASSTARGYSEVRALIDGAVTQRVAAPGTLVGPGQPILRVARIRPIRLQANVAEADLARIRVGAHVAVQGQNGTARASARVTTIAPSVDPVARTGVVEAIYPNEDGRFRPGQYVVMQISTGRGAVGLRVPVAAIRIRTAPDGGVISTRTQSYVWVAEPASGQDNQFTVHQVDVRTGASDGRYTEVTSGLDEGQQVVASGHQYLKAGDAVADIARAEQQAAAPAASEATVEVSSKGFTPASVTLKAGAPARLTFIRVDEENCGDVVLLPDYKIRRDLPLNKPVVVEFTPREGEIAFTCGMNMLRGKVVAR